jgi:hypothetical protein
MTDCIGSFWPISLKIDNKDPSRSIETTYNNYNTVRKAVKTLKNDKNGLFMSEKQLRK